MHCATRVRTVKWLLLNFNLKKNNCVHLNSPYALNTRLWCFIAITILGHAHRCKKTKLRVLILCARVPVGNLLVNRQQYNLTCMLVNVLLQWTLWSTGKQKAFPFFLTPIKCYTHSLKFQGLGLWRWSRQKICLSSFFFMCFTLNLFNGMCKTSKYVHRLKSRPLF